MNNENQNNPEQIPVGDDPNSIQPPEQGADGQTPPPDAYGQPPVQGADGQPPVQDTYSQTPQPEDYGQPPVQDAYSQTPQPEDYGQPPVQDAYSQTPQPEDYGQPPVQDAYSQTPQPEGYGQPPVQGEYGHGDVPSPTPPKKNRWLIPAIVVACVLVVVAGVFAFGRGGGGVSKTLNPEKYLATAIENTGNAMSDSFTAAYPNLDKFNNKSLGIDFSFSDQFSNMAGIPGTIAGSYRMDLEQSKQLMTLTLGPYKNNILFLSPELIAVSVPDIFPNFKYITVDPNTFEQDWATSLPGMFTPLPAEFQLKPMLDTFLGKSVNDEQMDQLQALTDTLQASRTFTDEKASGSDSAVMSYTYPPEALKSYYAGIADIMEAAYEPLMEMQDEYTRDQFKEVFTLIGNIEFNTPLMIRYTMNADDLVSKMDIKDFTMTIPTDYSYSSADPVPVTINATIDLLGTNNITDSIKATMYMTAVDMDPVSVVITRDQFTESTTIRDKWLMDLSMEGEEDRFLMAFDWEWNPAITDGDNMRLDARVVDTYDAETIFSLTGNLSDSDTETVLKNVNAQVTEYGYDDPLEMGLNLRFYSLKPGDADLEIAEGESIKFNEITMADLQALMGY